MNYSLSGAIPGYNFSRAIVQWHDVLLSTLCKMYQQISRFVFCMYFYLCCISYLNKHQLINQSIDEVHFILKCSFHDDLRKPIFQLANLLYPNFTELTDLEQLKVIFQSEDLLKTAFCLNRMYNRRSQMLTCD